ncbi:hypothetical protein ASPZODRAFT_1396923 [Penicilliopsis zonata CBS 506.65]|uniref:Uncharacterized protein n=1 Tax=Penicilliopsis zonata CBS 506.65 TaxID=1073090 RepID=A0A1L9SPA6_9EURO|nr:hypothetical protein ASPZODRAFT_1396923 [Penicilliopsis zonata CBS 506.65]OJJ49099.1 hypothetical protein ASPZODRAFT_1396923 [Penicilliopsis zonata CBS 506.65]
MPGTGQLLRRESVLFVTVAMEYLHQLDSSSTNPLHSYPPSTPYLHICRNFSVAPALTFPEGQKPPRPSSRCHSKGVTGGANHLFYLLFLRCYIELPTSY